MVFNATFNNIAVMLWWSVLLVEENKSKTTDLSQVIDEEVRINLTKQKISQGKFESLLKEQ